MSAIQQTAFARLEQEDRLLNPVLKEPTKKANRFGFRGIIAVKLPVIIAGEKRPPEVAAEQVLATAVEGEGTIAFLAAYLHSFEFLKAFADVLGETLGPKGKYFVFVNNIDPGAKFKVVLGEATFFILPIDEATVYNETLDLLRIEKNDLKKLDTAGKLDAIADAAAKFNKGFPLVTYEEGLALMGPVRDRGANRPV
jgi:hypothetical protein